MKFLAVFAFALIAVASADVSHLRQYLPPFEQQAAPAVQALPTNEQLRQYLPPAPPAAALPQPAPAPQEPRFAEPAAASFNEVDGYNYHVPQ